LFGDGLTGRLPILLGTGQDIAVSFAAGAGTVGNVGANLNWDSFKKIPTDPDLFIGAVNVVGGDGGSESETLDAARQRAAEVINERNRAVSKIDYENLAKTTPGVAIRRAFAAVGYNPDFPCTVVPGVVTVFVVPYAPRELTDGSIADDVFVAAPQPDPGALQAVTNQLNAARLLGSQVFVEGPAYRQVQLGVYIAVDTPLSASIRQGIVTRLQTYLDPLVGGEEEEGWPFGDPLRPSALLQQAQNVVGQAGDVLKVSVLIDGMTAPENCRDVPILPHELVALQNVDLYIHSRAVRSGGLR
jgi:predicted phage baseplate assembly protein